MVVTGEPHGATMAAVRTFNTTGPIDAEDHYHIPPLERIDLDEVLGLVANKKYFVLHAPRQTGKTSALLGRGRTDLLIVWPQGGRERRWVVECKLRRGDLERTIAEGVTQTRAYLHRCAAEAGHLIVFDRSPERTWEQKIFRREASGEDSPVTVWGM